MAPKAEQFPWELGVYDAHCHPTDTMSSIGSIPSMKTRCLTVMGTRVEDQSLVSSVADKHGIKSSEIEKWKEEECMVPCFGWHPWFAHMMYDDDDQNGSNTPDAKTEKVLSEEEKIRHYQNSLQPHREVQRDEDKKIYLSFPDPLSFSDFLSQTRERLQRYPLALIGEIGLDRSFRIPEALTPEHILHRNDDLTPGGREGRRLTPFRCAPHHQKAIFKKQLQLAAEYNRAVSIHGVQAHGLVYETLKELWKDHEQPVLSKRERKKRGTDDPSIPTPPPDQSQKQDAESKPYPPRICLHSYSGTASHFKQYLNPAIPVSIFASFSTAINLSDDTAQETPQSFIDVVKTVPDGMLLVESDLHTAGEEMDRRMEDIVRRVCKIKGWGLEEGVRILGANWRRFVFGQEEGENSG